MNKTEELIVQSQLGDQAALELLLTDNSGLIWSVAKRFVGRGADMDDLYQLGCVGFIKAVKGFDLNFGTQFSTYAVPKIAGEIRRFLRDDSVVKVSRSIKERAASIKLARDRMIHKLGREPTLQELVQQTGFTAEDIATAEMATASVESIQQPTCEDGISLENVLSDSQSEDVMLEQISLRQAILKLQERERMVIQLRYFHCMTQQQISVVLGVSQVQVSRIEKKALQLLREMLY